MDKYTLPCTPEWTPNIHQFAITDRVLGYDPVTGLDGVANAQGLQLGNRTLHLRGMLHAGHGEEGRHTLTDRDFLPGTRIPERALVLAYPTESLKTATAYLARRMETVREQADNMDDVSLSLAGAMRKLIPLSWRYAGTTFAYELFTDSVNMRDPVRVALLKEIAGDESIDVDDSSQLIVGNTYIIADRDGGNPETVEILDILTPRRVRCTKLLQISRLDGIITTSNLVIENGAGIANYPFLYLSNPVDVLVGAEYGLLHVRREIIPGTGSVEAEIDGEWLDCPLEEVRQYEDYQDDTYLIPARELRLRVRYTLSAYPGKFYSLVLAPVTEIVWIENILCPEILSVQRQDSRIVVSGSLYGSLYSIEHTSSELCCSPQRNIAANALTARGTGTELSIDVGSMTGRIFLYLRYLDKEGSTSRWSRPAVLDIEPSKNAEE